MVNTRCGKGFDTCRHLPVDKHHSFTHRSVVVEGVWNHIHINLLGSAEEWGQEGCREVPYTYQGPYTALTHDLHRPIRWRITRLTHSETAAKASRTSAGPHVAGLRDRKQTNGSVISRAPPTSACPRTDIVCGLAANRYLLKAMESRWKGFYKPCDRPGGSLLASLCQRHTPVIAKAHLGPRTISMVCFRAKEISENESCCLARLAGSARSSSHGRPSPARHRWTCG